MDNNLIKSNAKLTKQGYVIAKEYLSENQIIQIENELTIEPEVDIRYRKIIDDEDLSFNIYLESVDGKYFVLPRYYAINKFGLPSNIKFRLNELDRTNIQFNGTLRDYQHDVINNVLKEYCTDITNPSTSLKPFGGGIISIPPGKGKTVLGIYLATVLKLRTLIVVNKTFLLNQWKDRINQYTNAEIGIIQQDKIDINNRQFVVAMLHSISLKDYDRELFEAFPFVIFDECHHLGAKMFSKSLIKIQAPYFLGLSATPERKDNLEKVFKYFIGDIKYRGKFEPNNQVNVKLYSYSIKDLNFRSLYNAFLKNYNGQKMITNLCKIDQRNNLIIKIIKQILIKEPRRKILVLSGRCNASKNEKSVNHIQLLVDKLLVDTNLSDSWGIYIGGMKRVKLELSSEKQIILGTYEMAQEGLDIADLDTLILASPLKGDITQTCGRILRGGNIYNPLIIDIVDQIKPFSEQAKSRFGYYKSNDYKCEFFEIVDGNYIEDSNIKVLDRPFLVPTQKSLIKKLSDKDVFED
jgi:superfamily II DNA or RNA helicase